MFFFAWCGPDETFGPEHQVEDEEVFAFDITHQENDFAYAQIDIRNPRIGLLNEGRDQWAFLAYEGDNTDGVEPLFYGRLVGIPEQLQDEVVRLAFIARPLDFDAQKRALAETLKVRPYYDPIWIERDRRDDPDTVLEGYTLLWHIDRITHELTVSDILAGEDGTVNVTISDAFYDSLDVSYGQAPVRRVRVEAEIFWQQTASGEVNITRNLIDAFRESGSAYDHIIQSYTGDGLMTDWPRKGDRIGAGWAVGISSIRRTDGIVVDQEYTQIVTTGGGSFAGWRLPIWTMRPVLNVTYEAARRFTEFVSFDLEADVQAILTEPGDEEIILVTLATEDVAEPIDPPDSDNPDGAMPIGDLRRRAYMPTERGRESLEHLISLARARLLYRARTVEISFAVPFDLGLGLSCRKSVLLTDDRLPGGQAAGKIIGYSLSCNGDAGELACKITIGSAIGQGNSVTTAAGTPTYVEEGYVELGYQVYSGQTLMPISGEVTYEDFSDILPDDDGIDFFDMRADNNIEALFVINGVTTQRNVLNAKWEDIQTAVNAVNEVFTEVDLTLRPLTGGPFRTEYPIVVSGLMVPKQIDLEAEAA